MVHSLQSVARRIAANGMAHLIFLTSTPATVAQGSGQVQFVNEPQKYGATFAAMIRISSSLNGTVVRNVSHSCRAYGGPRSLP